MTEPDLENPQNLPGTESSTGRDTSQRSDFPPPTEAKALSAGAPATWGDPSLQEEYLEQEQAEQAEQVEFDSTPQLAAAPPVTTLEQEGVAVQDDAWRS